MVTDDKLTLKVYDAKNLPNMVTVFADCFPEEQWRADDFNRFWTQPSIKRSNLVKTLTDEQNRLRAVVLYSVHKGVCTIRRIGVPCHVRRRGYARYVLNTLCGNNGSTTCREFAAKVRMENTAAIRLFKSAGFTQEHDTQVFPVTDGQADFYVFRLSK